MNTAMPEPVPAPVPLTRAQAQALVDAVMAREGLALAAAAYANPAGEWVFEATCEGAPDVAAFEALAAATLGGAVGFAAAPLPETNWVEKSLEGLAPVAAGGFFIHGSHLEGAPPAGLTPILIDAGAAFGTGHHATTAGCLIAIDRELKRRRPKRILDLGCGSGVLAIALAKRLHAPVLATDIDPAAVAVARRNARANAVGNLVTACVADGLAHPRIAEGGPWDLIVANILAAPLRRLAPKLALATARGGTVIFSGLLAPQAAGLIALAADHDLVLARKLVRDGWATLTLTKA